VFRSVLRNRSIALGSGLPLHAFLISSVRLSFRAQGPLLPTPFLYVKDFSLVHWAPHFCQWADSLVLSVCACFFVPKPPLLFLFPRLFGCNILRGALFSLHVGPFFDLEPSGHEQTSFLPSPTRPVLSLSSLFQPCVEDQLNSSVPPTVQCQQIFLFPPPPFVDLYFFSALTFSKIYEKT